MLCTRGEKESEGQGCDSPQVHNVLYQKLLIALSTEDRTKVRAVTGKPLK